jgi:hypothetical protein
MACINEQPNTLLNKVTNQKHLLLNRKRRGGGDTIPGAGGPSPRRTDAVRLQRVRERALHPLPHQDLPQDSQPHRQLLQGHRPPSDRRTNGAFQRWVIE